MKSFFTVFWILSLSLNVFLLSSSFTNAHAKTFQISKTKEFLGNRDQLKGIILSYESYCKSGCKYMLSDVEEIKVLDRTNPNHFYIWTKIAGIRTFMYFSGIEIIESDGQTVIKLSTPKKEQIQYLKSKYALEHVPLFSNNDASWTLTDKYRSDGTFAATLVHYQGKFTSNSLVVLAIADAVYNGLRNTARDFFQALGPSTGSNEEEVIQ
ncbi:MAG: hypothetical protein HQK50_18300 [Oligoflexia bacterium]|nr:hypothetical protein [Oligoflexia bacterium]MBF0367532.1 hypothetical protein [Oligoflexia bacterium]